MHKRVRWTDELRRRLLGCPQAAKPRLKAVRARLTALLAACRRHVRDDDAAELACSLFDALLKAGGWRLENCRLLHP